MTESLARLAGEFRKLPAVGQKSAMRYAYRVMDMNDAEAEAFVTAIVGARKSVRRCKLCGDFCEAETCERCNTADQSVICVVKDPRDIATIERMSYGGLFHVLGGTLDYQKGVKVEGLRIDALLDRLSGVKEVIIATGTDIGGEMTAAYLSSVIKPHGVRVSRIACGVPIGSDLEGVDEYTLKRAIDERKTL